MSTAHMGQNYVGEDFIHETKQLAGGFSDGARAALAVKSIHNPDDVKAFSEGRNVQTGELLGRQQKNRASGFSGVVEHLDATINLWVAKNLTVEQQKLFATHVFVAGLAAMEWEERQTLVRFGAQGKLTAPGQFIALNAVHATNNKGEPNFHFHSVRKGHMWCPQERKAYSPFDKRTQMKLAADRSLVFQLHIAATLQDFWQVRVGFKNGRAVIGELKQTEIDTAFTRRKELLDYLDQKGVPATPYARAIAALATRVKPGEKEQFDHEAFAKRWKTNFQDIGNEQAAKAKRAPGEESNGLYAKMLEAMRLTAKIAYHGVRSVLVKRGDTVTVTTTANMEKLIDESSPGSIRDGQLGALRAVRSKQFKSFEAMLAAAKAGYKEGRRPDVLLKRGTRIVISRKVPVTEEQRVKLNKLANKYGWKLRYKGEVIKDDQKQQQTQKQSRRMRY